MSIIGWAASTDFLRGILSQGAAQLTVALDASISLCLTILSGLQVSLLLFVDVTLGFAILQP